MILAQLANPEPAALGIWLGCLAGLMVVLNQGAALVARFKESPPAHDKYATKAELAEVKGDIEDMRTALTANYNKIMESSADARRRLYEAINAVAAGVHRIEGALDAAKRR